MFTTNLNNEVHKIKEPKAFLHGKRIKLVVNPREGDRGIDGGCSSFIDNWDISFVGMRCTYVTSIPIDTVSIW